MVCQCHRSCRNVEVFQLVHGRGAVVVCSATDHESFRGSASACQLGFSATEVVDGSPCAVVTSVAGRCSAWKFAILRSLGMSTSTLSDAPTFCGLQPALNRSIGDTLLRDVLVCTTRVVPRVFHLPEVDRFSGRHMLSPIRFPGRERSFHRKKWRRTRREER